MNRLPAQLTSQKRKCSKNAIHGYSKIKNDFVEYRKSFIFPFFKVVCKHNMFPRCIVPIYIDYIWVIFE